MYNCIKSLTIATSSHRYGYTQMSDEDAAEARDENLPYTDDWLENTDNGHTYESNGFMTTTDFI